MADFDTRLVIVSGLSGAGKSTALHALEDLGYYCVDNLPTSVVQQVLDTCRQAGILRVALGVDVRARAFLERFGSTIDALVADPSLHVSIVFLDANDTALLARFSATRRPHPLSTPSEGAEREAIAVLDGITFERNRLAKVRLRATDVIDTTGLTVHDLRRRVVELFGPGGGRMAGLRVRLLSFGFKYGPPVDADVMLDVRFLRNPYFVDELRELTGLDEPVRRYVLSEAETGEFLAHARALIGFCVPRYEREGKAYLTIAVGCTGGKHRSVVVASELGAGLTGTVGAEVRVVHRDIGREAPSDRASEPDIIGGGVKGTGNGPG